jgi:hypothetical protein
VGAFVIPTSGLSFASRSRREGRLGVLRLRRLPGPDDDQEDCDGEQQRHDDDRARRERVVAQQSGRATGVGLSGLADQPWRVIHSGPRGFRDSEVVR